MNTVVMQPMEKDVWDMIAPGVDDMDLRIVRVRLTGGERPTLQSMIEPKASTAANRLSVTVGECGKVSRMISALMDVNDPIETAFHLEVSSTGVDRPLVTEEDFIDYVGANIKVVTMGMIDGTRKFKGQLVKLEEGMVTLKLLETEEEVVIALDNIKTAKLFFTDEEFNAMTARAS